MSWVADILAVIAAGLTVGISPGFRIPPARAVPAESGEDHPGADQPGGGAARRHHPHDPPALLVRAVDRDPARIRPDAGRDARLANDRHGRCRSHSGRRSPGGGCRWRPPSNRLRRCRSLSRRARSALSTAAAALDADMIWQRIEAYIAHRWTERDVTWIVEGPGEWHPPLDARDHLHGRNLARRRMDGRHARSPRRSAATPARLRALSVHRHRSAAARRPTFPPRSWRRGAGSPNTWPRNRQGRRQRRADHRRHDFLRLHLVAGMDGASDAEFRRGRSAAHHIGGRDVRIDGLARDGIEKRSAASGFTAEIIAAREATSPAGAASPS